MSFLFDKSYPHLLSTRLSTIISHTTAKKNLIFPKPINLDKAPPHESEKPSEAYGFRRLFSMCIVTKHPDAYPG